MWPTPDYKLDAVEDESVYPPSEDTFILLDALALEIEELRNMKPLVALEIGSGSGVVTAFLLQILSANSACGLSGEAPSTSQFFSICTDLNLQALKCTKKTASLNSIDSEKMDLVQCDLLEPLLVRLQGCVDILLFNPPYVPTDEAPAQSTKDFYYAGGLNGREVMNRILDKVAEILSPQGLFFMVALEQNDVSQILRTTSTRLRGSIVLERRCGIERLYVLKFHRKE